LVDTATFPLVLLSHLCLAARLGLKVAFVGVCGDDVFGSFMLNEMQKREVDVSNVIVRVGEQTGLSVILSSGSDRAILTHLGLIAALRAADIPDGLLRYHAISCGFVFCRLTSSPICRPLPRARLRPDTCWIPL
jgi:sugar/nucleoside kinase (ribokinase family)